MRLVPILTSTAALFSLAISVSCNSSAGNSATAIYAMGDRAQVGPLIYTVFETRWMPQLGADASARIPANRFLLLRVSVVNSGSADSSVPSLTLIDDNGQRYPELGNGEGVPQWAGFVRRLKSADTLTGNFLFDVPLRHYKLEVMDETEDKKALVDIPLSFGGDTLPMPPMPTPPQAPAGPRPVSPK